MCPSPVQRAKDIACDRLNRLEAENVGSSGDDESDSDENDDDEIVNSL